MNNALGNAASAVRDYRRPTRLGFDWRNAEIFFGRKDERAGSLHILPQSIRRLVSKQPNVGRCDRTELFQLGTFADDQQSPVWHLPERFDRQINPFVRNEPGSGEIEIFLFFIQSEKIRIHRWIYRRRLAAIKFMDPATDKIGIRDEDIDAMRRADVPVADVVKNQ